MHMTKLHRFRQQKNSMAIQKLTIVPSTILRQKSKDVILDKKTRNIIKDLGDTLVAQNHPRGVGLSAPQIAKNLNIFVTLYSPLDRKKIQKDDLRVFINPVIVESSQEMTLGETDDDPILEGCLSIPGLYGPLPRHKWVIVQYDRIVEDHFEKVQEKFQDFYGRVIQHEQDHLQGVLFIDYSLKNDLPVYIKQGKDMVTIDKQILKTY